MNSNQHNEMELALIQDTFIYLNRCLISSGLNPLIVRTCVRENVDPLAQPVTGKLTSEQLKEAESSILFTVTERALKLYAADLFLGKKPNDTSKCEDEENGKKMESKASKSSTLKTPKKKDLKKSPVSSHGKLSAPDVNDRRLAQFRESLKGHNLITASRNNVRLQDFAIYFKARMEIGTMLKHERAVNVNQQLLLLLRQSFTNHGLSWKEAIFIQPTPDLAKEMRSKRVELSFPARADFPQFANCIEMKQSGLVATKMLNAGDMIAIDQALCWYVKHTSYSERCDWCLEDDPLCLVPCTDCLLVMYCSKHCRQQAMESYHRMECFAMRELTRGQPKLEKWVLATLRSVCMSFALFDYDYILWREYFDPAKLATTVPLLQREWVKTTRGDVFCSLLRGVFEEKSQVAIPPVANELEKLCCSLKNYFKLENVHHKMDKFLLDFILWHFNLSLKLETTNEVILSGKEGGMCVESVSHGWYPWLDLFQHSCNPNVVLISVAPKEKAAFMLRPVKTGTALTVGRVSFYDSTKSFRTAYLMSTFGLTCQCDACQYEYMPMVLESSNALKDASVYKLKKRLAMVNNCGILKSPYNIEFLFEQLRLVWLLRFYFLEKIDIDISNNM